MTVAAHWLQLPSASVRIHDALSAKNTFSGRIRNPFRYHRPVTLFPAPLLPKIFLFQPRKSIPPQYKLYAIVEMMSILFGLRLVVFFHHFKDFGLHSQQTANVQRISGAILLALHPIQAIVHVFGDQFHAHVAGNGSNFPLWQPVWMQ